MLYDILKSIGQLYDEPMAEAKKRLDSLVKPAGSLGVMEEIICRIAGIRGEAYPSIDKKTVVIMCSDNGVVEEGVTSCPKEVTTCLTSCLFKGLATVNAFTRHAGAGINVVDIGLDSDLDCEGLLNRKIRRGTWNIAKGPAMTREEAVRAIETGISVVKDLHEKGYNMLGTGEVGIGNTTTSCAISSVLTSSPVEDMVGRGAGLSDQGLLKKIATVKKAIEVNKANPDDPIDVLAKLGGFDIAGLAGCFIGAAAYRIPILIDGFISSCAALLAVRMEPKVRAYVFSSHGSAEPGSRRVMKELGLEPILNLGMRVGEGTGTALAFNLIDAAFEAYTKMGTYEDAEIDKYMSKNR
jgi:nicotinate-nucleotide--dimethylbenzimidazole phosphoribosyltransferase